MSESGIEILIILLLVLLNGVFSLSEMSVVSSRKVRLQQRANEGDAGAFNALRLAESPNVFLSTIQIGITLIGVLSGAVGGVGISKSLAGWFDNAPILEPYATSLGVGVVVISITFLTLILGELVPKRVALHNPERIASMIAAPMSLVSRIFSPVVYAMSATTDLVLRMIGVKPNLDPPITEEEIQVLIDQGTQAGVFDAAEQDMVQGVFSLSDRRIFSLMTPRSEIAWLDVHDTPEEIRQKIEDSPFSRFPVCEDSLDTIIGIIEARDLLLESLHGNPLQLKRNIQLPVYIPETARASRVLELFKSQDAELMLVIDEFGSVQGLVTVFDIIEEIVGDIDPRPQATQRQDGSWLLDGMLEVEDFKEIFNLRHLPDEDEYETLSGFVMLNLGRVPQATDRFEWNGLIFEVMDMDGKRVDKVLVTIVPKVIGSDERASA
ncbi:MAG: hemolysin family protein [Anaerolineales bacterium]|jgi:putative hemolysin|nr:hemolysin family protein [Anaerolineales bacterium]